MKCFELYIMGSTTIKNFTELTLSTTIRSIGYFGKPRRYIHFLWGRKLYTDSEIIGRTMNNVQKSYQISLTKNT